MKKNNSKRPVQPKGIQNIEELERRRAMAYVETVSMMREMDGPLRAYSEVLAMRETLQAMLARLDKAAGELRDEGLCYHRNAGRAWKRTKIEDSLVKAAGGESILDRDTANRDHPPFVPASQHMDLECIRRWATYSKDEYVNARCGSWPGSTLKRLESFVESKKG